jgi:hypothetical protein
MEHGRSGPEASKVTRRERINVTRINGSSRMAPTIGPRSGLRFRQAEFSVHSMPAKKPNALLNFSVRSSWDKGRAVQKIRGHSGEHAMARAQLPWNRLARALQRV